MKEDTKYDAIYKSTVLFTPSPHNSLLSSIVIQTFHPLPLPSHLLSLRSVVVIGDTAVGKTNLLHRWLEDRFDTTSPPTVGSEFHAKTYNANGSVVKMQLWDTGPSNPHAPGPPPPIPSLLPTPSLSRLSPLSHSFSWARALPSSDPPVLPGCPGWSRCF